MNLTEVTPNKYNLVSYFCEYNGEYCELIVLENLKQEKFLKVMLLTNFMKYKQGMSFWDTYDFFNSFKVIKSFGKDTNTPIFS